MLIARAFSCHKSLPTPTKPSAQYQCQRHHHRYTHHSPQPLFPLTNTSSPHRYTSKAALEAHESSETFMKTAGQLKDLLARPLSIYWSRPVAGFENRDRGTLHI